MTNVMEAQQELISGLVAACRADRRVPDPSWLASVLRPDGPGDLPGLLRTVYPYAEEYAELPEVQRELILERVRAALLPSQGGAPLAQAPRPATVG